MIDEFLWFKGVRAGRYITFEELGESAPEKDDLHASRIQSESHYALQVTDTSDEDYQVQKVQFLWTAHTSSERQPSA
ncbi:predicted protein [Sclerotinia sclerotiorum 1980 UF-70]|uniref:Uncharacterized protein n=1 Tax=Sclerotinia sclerotiorum (strain ATCC 18683 / 1980 / Ss-1) TaxID=665079 RepID=A7E5W5_SCLS1|nr:predicted protein [Sclerotinia sclerotiorum 1980 UF-70]EDN91287.1 predicted protein [Sclerotinia sclerotiorum 1980 UF-70]